MTSEARNALVLIVEDDVFTQKTIQEVVELEGATVRLASSVQEAREAIEASTPDIVILDINLPDELGFSLAKEIRENHDAGIIILTVRDSEGDRLLGLELGADEYLTKPVSPRELGIRVRNMLGRIDAWSQPQSDKAKAIAFGDWRFFPAKRQLNNTSGQTQNLTRLESDILFALARRPDHVFHREELVGFFHSGVGEKSIRAADNIIMRLRRKLGENIKGGGHIVTVSGQGYCFRQSPEK